MKYGFFRSRGLQMTSHKLLTLAHSWLKNDQMCISKKQKLQREAQFGHVKHAFEATHSDSRAKIVTFFLLWKVWKSLKMHCIFPPELIMKGPKKQAWCKLASKWLRKNIDKTNVILHICSKYEENHVFRIQWFISKMSKSLFGSPRAPVERPETPPRPHREPRGTINAWKTNEKSVENGHHAVDIPRLFRLETSNPSPIKCIYWSFGLRWKEFQIDDNQWESTTII